MNTRRIILLAAASSSSFLALTGCTSQTGPDSNTQVFETAEKATAARKQKLLVDWQEMTLKIANAERPDVKSIKAPGFAIQMSADGVSRTLDLTPLTEQLASASQTSKEREPIRQFLAQEFPKLDRERLKGIGFERARPLLFPYLANGKQTGEMSGADAKAAPLTNNVVIDLNWLPVVRWPGGDARTPIDADVLAAWNVPAARVNDAALANLRAQLDARPDGAFETIDLPGLGRYGSLRAGVDPAVLLLPDFLATVREQWKTGDDLVVSFPSRITVSFVERKNEKLLNTLMPQWSKRYTQVSDPMISTMLLLGDAGHSLFEYKPPAPATKPATQPTTKRVYITS